MANKHAKAKNLRVRALVSLVAIIVVVAVCAYLGLCGFGKGTMINYLKPWGDAISLGLDLRGGVYTVYQAENNGDPDFDTKMESTVSILTSRLTRQGFTEATVTRQGSDRIRVEIPNVSDPNQILTIIGTPAQLYFVDESGNNLMEGAMVKNAQAAQDQDGKPCIAFELTDEGAKIFAEATAANLGKTISITLDGETISRATVNTVIAGGKGEITGNFTADEAKNLATLILSGALPLNLTQLEVSAISATLGVEALDRAIQAGIIGVALVMLFMLFRYRLCGLVADIALTIYIMIVVLLLALPFAPFMLLGRRAGQARALREAFDDADSRRAVCAMFRHVARYWAAYFPVSEGLPFSRLPEAADMPDDYAAAYRACADTFLKAAYSDAPITQAERDGVKILLDETERLLYDEQSAFMQLKLRYRYLLR